MLGSPLFAVLLRVIDHYYNTTLFAAFDMITEYVFLYKNFTLPKIQKQCKLDTHWLMYFDDKCNKTKIHVFVTIYMVISNYLNH